MGHPSLGSTTRPPMEKCCSVCWCYYSWFVASSWLSFRSSLSFDRLPAWKEFRSKPLEAQLAALKDPATRDDAIALGVGVVLGLLLAGRRR